MSEIGVEPRAVPSGSPLAALLARVEACRICVDCPVGAPLPHPPRPVARPSATARLLIAGQAPGNRVHQSGIPFNDPSGDRLRGWLGFDRATFYDTTRVAILPMGFCFPGLDAKGGDLPPRRECAPAWRATLLAEMPQVALVLAIGKYAQAWHLGRAGAASLTATVADWRAILARPALPRVLPLPHPSWRNTGWLKRNPWFEADLLPALRAELSQLGF
ncbi:MAG: uracil-DNA glycosylase family protein [Hyphomicrobiaceae bacterium]|nr:uracil-DNA glycosylase family protein [Hyphomicrobiaceae bacterium]